MFRSMIIVLAALAFNTQTAFGAEDHNSTRSNINTKTAYPDDRKKCEDSGGVWVESGGNGFCFKELSSSDARSKAVAKYCSENGGEIISIEKKSYCASSNPDLQKKFRANLIPERQRRK